MPLISSMSPKEAEAWAGGWAGRFLSIMAEASGMAEFSAAHFTKEGRERGTLVRGQDKRGQNIAWTDAELEAVADVFKVPLEVLTAMQQRRPDGMNLKMLVEQIARPQMMIGPNGQQGG